MRIIGNSSLDEPKAKILGMRARASRAVGPHKVGAYMSVWQLLTIFGGHTQWRRCHGRGSVPPDIFNMKKLCVKSISHKFWSRRIYPECIWVEHFRPTNYWVGREI